MTDSARPPMLARPTLLRGALAAASLLACATTAPASAQLRLGPGTVLPAFANGTLRPTFINDAGTIVGSYALPILPTDGPCDAECSKSLIAEAYGFFLMDADGPIRRIGHAAPAALSETIMIAQERPPKGYPYRPYFIDLKTLARGTEVGPDRCYVADVDARGRILSRANQVLGPETLSCGYLIDARTGETTSIDVPAHGKMGACQVSAMNESGFMVGAVSDIKTYVITPMVWDASGGYMTLPTDPRWNRFLPLDINARGTILGRAAGDGGRDMVVWWDGDDHALHVFGEGTASVLNDADVAAGYKTTEIDSQRNKLTATLFDLRRGVEVALFGPNGDGRASEATDINNAGVAIGVVDDVGVIFPPYR